MISPIRSLKAFTTFRKGFTTYSGRGESLPVISEPRDQLLFHEGSHSLRAYAWMVDLGAFPAGESMGRTCDVFFFNRKLI